MTEKTNEPLLTIKDVAKKFNIKESRIRWEVFHKRIPFYKIGSSILFRASEVEIWIQESKRGVQ